MNPVTTTGPTPMDIYDASNANMGPSSSPARLPYISEKHPRHTLEAINVLRKHRELCDVVLIVGQRRIFGHRVVLSACSPYFHAMFTGELAESRQTEASLFKWLFQVNVLKLLNLICRYLFLSKQLTVKMVGADICTAC